MQARGYRLDPSLSASLPYDDLAFDGQVVLEDALVLAIFNDQNQLVKIGIVVLTSDTTRGLMFTNTLAMYESLKEDLSDKYGAPSSSLESFSEPYYLGDGFEAQAFEQGKGTYQSVWIKTTMNGAEARLSVAIDINVNVSVEYESPYWDEEYNKRGTAGTSDF